MSATTELVRETVSDVLEDEPDVDRSLARSIGTKIAGDPALDRVDISEDSIELVVHTVADATYRINLDGFGVADPSQARRNIVEKVHQHFVARTTETDGDPEPSSDASGEPDTRDEQSDGESDDDIIIANSESVDEVNRASGSASDTSETSTHLRVDGVVVSTDDHSVSDQSGTDEVENGLDDSEPDDIIVADSEDENEPNSLEETDDDIIVAESDDCDLLDTVYDDDDDDDGDDSGLEGEQTIHW
ncbi:hypothetical protein [Haloarchaeobius sp. TZWSO28]|uniref:hypothetical protein n=1 Tax=Haloarchaeobius sp. TZWSO28 TaxID=3446119 RepID=UPI003EBB23FA